MHSQNSQDSQDEHFTNQTTADNEIYEKQYSEFKALLDKVSFDSNLSFEEKVAELNNILLKQQDEIIANSTAQNDKRE